MKKTKANAEVEYHQHVVVIRPECDLDMESVPELRKFFIKRLKTNDKDVIVDLENVQRVDTSGLAVLVEFAGHLKDYGRTLSVCGLKNGSTDTLSLQQVSDILHFSSDCSEAFKRIEKNAEPPTRGQKSQLAEKDL